MTDPWDSGRSSAWQYIPSGVLQEQEQADEAASWAGAQREQLGGDWAAWARQQTQQWLEGIKQTFQQQAVAAPDENYPGYTPEYTREATPAEEQALLTARRTQPTPLSDEEAARQYAGQGVFKPGDTNPLADAVGSTIAADLDMISRPQQALFGVTNEALRQPPIPVGETEPTQVAGPGMARALLEGLRGERRTQGTQLLETAGVGPGLGRDVGGFVIDALYDPLGLGAVGDIDRAVGGVSKLAERVAPGLRRAGEFVDAAARSPELRAAVPGGTVEQVASKRYYHGTGSAFDKPGREGLNPDSLYGPAYYGTDEPAIASMHAGRVDTYNTAPNVRAFNAPDNLNLLDADGPVSDRSAAQRILSYLREIEGELPSGALEEVEASVNGSGDEFYRALERALGQRSQVNRVLASEGFDGIRYSNRIYDEQVGPILGKTGDAMPFTDVAIFPESLPKIRNVISGSQGGRIPAGLALDVGSGTAGGAAGYATAPEGSTPEQRLQGAAMGAVAGVMGGRALQGGLKGALPGNTIEDASKRVAGRPTSADPATQAVLDMIAGKTPGADQVSVRRAVQAALTRATRQWTDRKVDLAQFQEGAHKALGRPLHADEMAYELSRLTPDMAARVKVQEQIRPALLAVGEDQPFLSAYLMHLDNVDVAAAMGNDARKFSGGLTVADSQRALASLPAELGPERWAKMEQAGQAILDANKAALQQKLDSGIISQTLYDDLTTKYPHYVPTRITDYLKDPEMVPVGKRLSLSDSGLRRNTVEGTTKAREDPLASTVRNVYETERLAMKNDAVNAFLKLREAKPEYQALIREVKADYSVKVGEKAITGFTDGVKRRYVMPTDLARTVEWDGPAPMAGLARVMNLWKQLLTSKSPVFLSANALLDAGSYLIRETSRAGGPTPGNVGKIVKALAEGYADAFKGLTAQTYHGKTAEFLKGGGGYGGWSQQSAEGAKQSVGQLARANVFTVQGPGGAQRLLKDLFTLEPITAVGERIELAPRVASMKLAEQAGANRVKKIINGRTVTIDFDQGGEIAKQWNQLIPFFNVGLQAGAQIPRTIIENPKGALATFLGGPAAMTVAAEAWNNADPERRKAWDDVPQYVKDRHIGFVISGAYTTDKDGNRRPLVVSLPMREFSPFVITTREIVNRVLGKEARPWNELLGGMATQISPIQGDTLTQAAGGLVFPIVSTALELGANKNFYTGGAIASEYKDKAASAASKGLAGALPPEWGIRPSQIEYAARDIGGGVAAAGLAASDLATGTVQDQGIRSIPVLGGIAGRFLRSDIGGNLDTAQEKLLSPEAQRVLKEAGVSIGVSPVMGTISKVPLTMDEQAEYQALVNKRIDEAVKYVPTIKGYDTASADDREATFRKYFDLARAKAREEMQAKIGAEEGKRRIKAGTAGGQR